MKKTLLRILVLLVAFFSAVFPVLAHEDGPLHNEPNIAEAVIYYNEACGACAVHVNEELPQTLQNNDISLVTKKDYVNEKENRVEMNRLLTALDIPFELQSHIMTFVGDKYVLGGHVPVAIVNDLFQPENSQRFKRIVVYQDKMHGEIVDYKVWAIPAYADNYVGEVMTYSIDTPVIKYLDYLEDNRVELMSAQAGLGEHKSIWSLVLLSGLLDGFNPCAFAVLIFFIAFLFTLQRSMGSIVKFGLIYILVIYLTYLGIGFGLFKALVITDSPHLMAKVGSWLVIVLGLINIKDYIFPKLPLHLRIPKFSQSTLKYWLTKATLPAVIIGAFLVGLCTFPCSGGIYVAIIGLLAVRHTFWSGLGYMLAYNLMFVVPLLVLLALAGNRLALGKVAKWQSQNDKTVKLVIGISMIVIGLIILIFFV